MDPLLLRFTLQSDATFGRGDGVAGLVDEEVQHDEFGLPYLSGRTLKGLLAEECAEILFSLEQVKPNEIKQWKDAAQFLFGSSGSGDESARMHVGDAQLPSDLRAAIARDFVQLQEKLRDKKESERERAFGLKRGAILESLTALRRQTAMDASGAPKKETLRTMRVIVRGTPFEARLDFVDPGDEQLAQNAGALLAACIKALRRAGSGKNRGRGRLHADLYPLEGAPAVTDQLFTRFRQAVNP